MVTINAERGSRISTSRSTTPTPMPLVVEEQEIPPKLTQNEENAKIATPTQQAQNVHQTKAQTPSQQPQPQTRTPSPKLVDEQDQPPQKNKH